MSSVAGSDAAAIIAEQAESMIANYCAMAGIVFLLYEFTITFGREVELFWLKGFTGATALYLSNKYLTLLNHSFDLSLFIPFHISNKTCDLHAKAFSSLDYLQYVPWAAFSGLRCFALSRRWSLSILVFALSLVPLGVNFSVHIYGVNDPNTGCGMGEDTSPELSLKLVLIARTCLLAADILLVIVTWAYLPRHHVTSVFSRRRPSFTDVVLRDGTIYFLVLIILNTFHIVFSFSSTSEFTYFTEPLNAVLVSRFLLNLQEAKHRAIRINDTDKDILSSSFPTEDDHDTVLFARVVGSIASTISPDMYLSNTAEQRGDGSDEGCASNE